MLMFGHYCITTFDSKEKLRHIFSEITNGRGEHGSFLHSFAKCYLDAGAENEALLNKAAIVIAEKYNIIKYLDNYTGER